jgi:hypothetical protein
MVAMVMLFLLASLAVGCSSDDADTSGSADMSVGSDEGRGSGGSSRAGGGADGSNDSYKVRSAALGDEPEQMVVGDSLAQTESGETESGDAGGASTGSFGAPEIKNPIPSVGPAVIKKARIEVEVEADGFRDAVQTAIDTAESNRGFILSTETGGAKTRRGSIVLRVPAEFFESTLGELKSLGKVTGEAISGEDVSQEFVDLQARLRNLGAQERVLLELFDEATSVVDTIRIGRELEDVQLGIEQLRGRIRFLKDQTSFSTIKLELVEEGIVAADPPPTSRIAQAWAEAKDMFVTVVSAVIVGAGFVFPLMILLALVALAARVIWPRLNSERT